MPELPEVEASRRLIESALLDKRISLIETRRDEIVYKGQPEESIEKRFTGDMVKAVGRKGKYFWIEFSESGFLLAHLGMSGAILDITPDKQKAINYHERKGIKFDDGTGFPTYLKLLLEAEDGSRIALVDPRRLARIWSATNLEQDRGVGQLGPDALSELPKAEELEALLKRRKTPIKALLLNQSFLAGIGNYLADEVLYQARIAPARLANTLGPDEVAALHSSITSVINLAVEADADYTKFPESWIFHYRWGGSRGHEMIEGKTIQRDTVGGRTTAWVPLIQK